MMQIAVMSGPREGAWLWLAKVLTGVLVFVLLVIHLVVNHLVAADGLLTYADVIAYYANPLIPLIEGVFLVLVVTHALLGIRGIIYDLDPAPAIMRGVDIVLGVTAIVAIGYGIWLLQLLAARAAG